MKAPSESLELFLFYKYSLRFKNINNIYKLYKKSAIILKIIKNTYYTLIIMGCKNKKTQKIKIMCKK
jgi:hypothetical protein